jgi:nucleotide-binding universal stress UspA family protein
MSEDDQRIVVGVDGSEHSKQALRWATALGAQIGATVDAVMAWDFPTSVGWSAGTYVPDTWNPETDAQTSLETTIDEVFGSERPDHLRATVQEGHAAKVLLDQSKSATMLVVGGRGHGGLAGRLLGSASKECAEHATCPVLVVHGDQPPPAPTHTHAVGMATD